MSPLVHFLVREIRNWLLLEEQELIIIVGSVVVQDFTHAHLIGRVNISVVLSE
ncbi:MAG: hypothetical protein WCL02_04055 [bacterium]